MKTRGTDLTSVCPPHHDHTRENPPGAPPHIGVVGLVSLISVGSQRVTLSELLLLSRGTFRNFLTYQPMSETRSPPHAEEEEPPPAEEEEADEDSISHPRRGRRGGDSRKVVGTNRSIRHSDSVRQVGVSGAAGGGAGGAAGGAATGAGGDDHSEGSQASSSDYCSFRDDEYDHNHRRSRRGTRRSCSPSRRHSSYEEYQGGERGASCSSSLLNSTNITAINNLLSEHLAKGEFEQINSLLTAVSGLYDSPPVCIPVAPSTMYAASGMMQKESVSPPPVNTRMNPNDFASLTKFSGNEDDKNLVVDRMDQYEAFVMVSLKSRSA